MRRTYKAKTFNAEHEGIIARANQVCAQYAADGYDLTLRQLYYQFVARGWLANNQRNYKRLGGIINDARLAGEMDWSYIVDRTRRLEAPSTWSSPGGVIRSAARSYALDLWQDQPVRVEVWVEKEALAGVIERIADQWACPWFACRGYVSQSEQWAAGQRLGNYIDDRQRVVILHLGDHDPSGMDMTRDIAARLTDFITQDWLDHHSSMTGSASVSELWAEMAEHIGTEDRPFEVRRIALNMDQVEEYDPPPNPAKLTDSRVVGYMDRFGGESWELDALDPPVMAQLVADQMGDLLDDEAFDAMRARQEHEREVLTAAADRWAEVADLVSS